MAIDVNRVRLKTFIQTGIVTTGFTGFYIQFFNGLIIILSLIGHQWNQARYRSPHVTVRSIVVLSTPRRHWLFAFSAYNPLKLKIASPLVFTLIIKEVVYVTRRIRHVRTQYGR
jgi:hypothetical protein